MITAVKKLIKIGKEPVVILPLRKWEKMTATLEDLEERMRFLAARQDSRGKKGISLTQLAKKYGL